jgi:hypothetical protein
MFNINLSLSRSKQGTLSHNKGEGNSLTECYIIMFNCYIINIPGRQKIDERSEDKLFVRRSPL